MLPQCSWAARNASGYGSSGLSENVPSGLSLGVLVQSDKTSTAPKSHGARLPKDWSRAARVQEIHVIEGVGTVGGSPSDH